MKPTVIVRFDEYGELEYHATGDCRLLIVDEKAANDRVYEWLNRSTPEQIAEIIGDSEIGSNEDARHGAIKHKIEALINGKPRLSVVPADKGES